MAKRRNGFENQMMEARLALHEAAKAIAELASEEAATANRKQDTGNRQPKTRKPRPRTPDTRPSSPMPRPVPVFPTGRHEQDVANLEKAIVKAGEGGVVLLKAKDRSGKNRAFNLTSVTDLTLPFEISLRSEKDARIKFSQ